MYRTKTISAEVKDVSMKDREVKLYYSQFGKIDSDGDVVQKGALAKTQNDWGPKGKNRIWHLDNHMTSQRIGKPKEMGEDDYGAWAVTKVRDTQAGRDAMVLYDAGDITEHSFGFRIINSEEGEVEGHQATILTELQQFEYSSVNWGANMNTPTVEVKSMTDLLSMKEELLGKMKKWHKWLVRGNLSDELCEKIAEDLEVLQLQIKQIEEFEETLHTEEPSGKDTPEVIEAVEIESMFERFTLKHQIGDLFHVRQRKN